VNHHHLLLYLVEMIQIDPAIIALLVGAVTLTVFVMQYFNSNKVGAKSTEVGGDVSKGLKKEEASSSSGNLTSIDAVLSPSQFQNFTVLKITKVSHNTKLIRFELHPDKSLGLKLGRHITVRADIDGNRVMRSYTPTTSIDQKGYFDLLIKSYEFGKMSSYLTNLQVGQRVEIRGPIGRFQYTVNQYSKMGFIAGGTGITPCLQVIRTILECNEYAEDKTQFVLFYQNRTEEDILLYNEIQALQSKYPSRFVPHYFLSNSMSTTWGTSNTKANHYKGYINAQMISQHLQASQYPWVGICGPSGFNDCVKQLLLAAGHEEGQSIFIW
jgi:cytochrome-b5 reductase